MLALSAARRMTRRMTRRMIRILNIRAQIGAEMAVGWAKFVASALNGSQTR